jgi:hypothetical protein
MRRHAFKPTSGKQPMADRAQRKTGDIVGHASRLACPAEGTCINQTTRSGFAMSRFAASWGAIGWGAIGWGASGWGASGWGAIGWNAVGWVAVGWVAVGWVAVGWVVGSMPQPAFAQVPALPGAAPEGTAPEGTAGGTPASNAARGGPADEAQAGDPLALEQAQVAERYKRLEELLLKLAELESANNPTRAALLQQAAQLGKQGQLNELLNRAAKNLEDGRLSQAVEDQKTSRESLNRLLELLQSENRQDRVREQRETVKRWIEETDRLRRLQSSLRGRTEGGQATEKAAQDQDKLAQKAREIARDVSGGEDPQDDSKPADPQTNDDPSGDDKSSENKSGENKSGENQSGENQSGENQSGENQSGENQSGENQSGENQSGDDKTGENKSGDDKSGDDKSGDDKSGDDKSGDDKSGDDKSGDDKSGDEKSGDEKSGDEKSGDEKSGENKTGDDKSGENKSGENKSGEQQSGEQQSGEQQSGEQQSGEQQSGEQQSGEQEEAVPKDPTQRAAQRLKRAQQKMQDAQKQLEDAQRKGAVEKQREAERELEAAIEELEEILRQLREEEIERSLAALESRLRGMLQMQTKIYEETQRLSEISGGEGDRQVEIRASSLSLEERKVLAEGQRALLLLREEGTSAAFPEAMQQVLADVQSVVERLARADIGKLTVAIEQEIISSLEEMIEALVAVQKDQKKRQEQRQQGQPQQGQPGDQPLVDQLAELRLIRTLQIRVNKRTQTLSEALRDPNDIVGQAEATDMLEQIRGLADRQSSIQQVTRDIVVGKNK